MFVIAASAAFVGWIHSLAPAHWIPIVLIAKGQKWNRWQSFIGALVAASGHIFISVALGLAAVAVEVEVLESYGEWAEENAGLLLLGFGLLYSAYSYRQHSRCHHHYSDEHEHHGPKPPKDKKKLNPFIFLFGMGFSPCVAALPLFLSAAAISPVAVGITVVAFGIGVVVAMAGASWAASVGMKWLDHPILEHYGDVIAGLAIAALGLVMYFMPEIWHHH